MEQEIRRIDLKTRKLAYKFLVEEAKVNPAVKLQLMEAEFGIKIPKRDPLKKAKEKIHEVIIDETADKIESNPKLVEHLAHGLIKNYATELGIQTNEAPGTPFERELQQIEQYHKIREGLGFGDSNSILDSLKNPQVLVGLIGLAAQAISVFGSNAKPPERIYVVPVDGEDIQLTEDEHTAYKRTGTLPTSTKSQNTTEPLPETVSKPIQSDEYQPGDGIQLLIYPPPQMVAR